MKLMIIIFLLCFSFINNNFKLNANVPLTTDAKSSILIEMNTKPFEAKNVSRIKQY